MSLAPTQDITRKELRTIINALDCYYMSDVDFTDEDEVNFSILKEKIKTIAYSDFDVCQLQTLK